jgi:hypothetical protein
VNALILDIQRRWNTRLQEWERLHVQVDGRTVAAEILSDLEQLSDSSPGVSLRLGEAAELSGYSADHLSRLIRAGKLTNCGRKGAPRIRRDELPMRPTRQIASALDVTYDPNTDARSLRVRR